MNVDSAIEIPDQSLEGPGVAVGVLVELGVEDMQTATAEARIYVVAEAGVIAEGGWERAIRAGAVVFVA
ncbi:hypothetical protein ACI2L4_09965 [Streptomyces sparsogenes]|uniref:hypothetical protein n=1 Tax=Streptomyces sparsogenes TaxID=67365 RepID=UPI00384AE6BB